MTCIKNENGSKIVVLIITTVAMLMMDRSITNLHEAFPAG